jgi:hypothetical protein
MSDTKQIFNLYKIFLNKLEEFNEKNYENQEFIEAIVNVMLVFYKIRLGALLQTSKDSFIGKTIIKLIKQYNLYYKIIEEPHGDQIYFSHKYFSLKNISNYNNIGKFLGYNCGSNDNDNDNDNEFDFDLVINEDRSNIKIFSYNCKKNDSIKYVIRDWKTKITKCNKIIKKYGMQISLSISFPEGILPEEENNSDTIISESSFTDTNITPDELDEIESLNREMDNLA